jgi:hypothetical protein
MSSNSYGIGITEQGLRVCSVSSQSIWIGGVLGGFQSIVSQNY